MINILNRRTLRVSYVLNKILNVVKFVILLAQIPNHNCVNVEDVNLTWPDTCVEFGCEL